MNVENHMQLAQNLVNLFYPLVEATLFNARGIIQEIFNPFSTIKEDQELDVQNCHRNRVFSELLVGGRNVKSIIYPYYRDNLILGYLRVRYDLTHFKNLQEQLLFLVQTHSQPLLQATIDPWKRSIDQTIKAYLSESKLNLPAISAKQKRELINRLQEKGLFDFKESSAYVASKLQISRATVYNYLKTTATFRNVQVHQVDAFTNKKFGGNPAGVVLDADDLDENTMRKIARELNLSETAFVMSSKKATLQMRYFTPTGHEISFCGHSTVGALYMMAQERRLGMEQAGIYPFDVETACGILKMEAEIENNEEIKVAYETPTITLRPIKITHSEVAKAAGFDEHLMDNSFPVKYEETNKDLFVVIRSLEALKKIECDPKSFANFSKQHDIVALCLFCSEAFDSQNQFHMRCFAPLVGVSEDPFTGSVLGGLAAYVDTFKFLPKKKNSFRVEQGHFIERPGVVKVEFLQKGKTYKAKVFAQAIHCFSTEIKLT